MTRLLIAAVAGVAGATSLVIAFAGPQLAAVSASAPNPGGAGQDGDDGRPGDGGPTNSRPEHQDDKHGDDQTIRCDTESLMSAILRAEQARGGNISLAKNCTYVLTRPAVSGSGTGLPAINTKITIHGNGATITRVAGGVEFRLFEVASGGELNLFDVNLIGGRAGVPGGGGALLVGVQAKAHLSHATLSGNFARFIGGAIANLGELSIEHSNLVDNHVEAPPLFDSAGAAIYHFGAALTIKNTTIRDNTGADLGGAIWADNGTTRLTHVTVRNNKAFASGGGLYLGGLATIVESSIVDNDSAGNGGGIFSDASSNVRIHQSRIAGNTAGLDGGGVYANATMDIDGTSIAGNQAGQSGGGLYGFGVTLRDSKVEDNRAIGAAGSGAGITGGDITLIDSNVVRNRSSLQPGGVKLLSGSINLVGSSQITNNSPTNCTGNTQPIPGCAG